MRSTKPLALFQFFLAFRIFVFVPDFLVVKYFFSNWNLFSTSSLIFRLHVYMYMLNTCAVVWLYVGVCIKFILKLKYVAYLWLWRSIQNFEKFFLQLATVGLLYWLFLFVLTFELMNYDFMFYIFLYAWFLFFQLCFFKKKKNNSDLGFFLCLKNPRRCLVPKKWKYIDDLETTIHFAILQQIRLIHFALHCFRHSFILVFSSTGKRANFLIYFKQ